MNKYVYETEDKIKMELILNLDKVYKSLKNFKDCYKRIYNRMDYRSTKKYYYKGKIYTEEELAKLTEEKIEKDLDEKVSQKENIINKQTNIYPNEDYKNKRLFVWCMEFNRVGGK